MIHFIFWFVFIVFMVLVFRSKGWKERRAEAGKDGKYYRLSLYLLPRGAAVLLVLTFVGIIPPILDISSDICYEMWVGLVAWCVWLGYGGYAYFSGVDTYFRKQQLQKDAEGAASEKRGALYYVLATTILVAILYSLYRTRCIYYVNWGEGRQMEHDLLNILVLLPPILAGASVLFNILTIVSNRKHHIGIRNGWSKAAMIFTIFNVFIIPACYALRAGISADDYYSRRLSIEPGMAIFVFFLLGALVYMGGYIFIMYFHKWIGGYKEPHGLFLMITDSMAQSTGASVYKAADYSSTDYSDFTREENSSWGNITDDYYGKHGEFDINDEARRISEDMQQFHNANPDADLTDHYYWDDVLDAETDGYLEDDE